MPAAAPPLLLKVLSGPHVGAEVALRDGETIIGSADECDVILSDAFISPKHLKLDIRGGKARAQGLAEGTFLDGKPFNGQLTDLAHFQLLTVGGTHLMIGPKGAAWPAPKTQLLPALVNTQAAAPQAAPAPAAAPATPESKSAAAAPATAVAVTPAKRRMHLTMAGMGIILLVSSLTIAYLMRPMPERAPEVAVTQLVQERVEHLPFAKKLIIEPQGSRALVKGQVETAEQRRQAMAALAPLGDRVTVRIVSQDQLFESARQLLRTLNMPVEAVALETDSTLQVRGVVKSRDDWARALMHLKQDLPGLTKIRDENVIAVPQLLTKVGDVLGENGLTGQVQATWQDNALVMRGSITDSLIPAWRSFGEKLSEKVGFPVEMRDEVRLAGSPNGIPIPAGRAVPIPDGGAISSIVLDRMSWVVLKNGKRLFAGSALPGGYTLDAISPEGVKISNGKDARLLRVGDNLWPKP